VIIVEDGLLKMDTSLLFGFLMMIMMMMMNAHLINDDDTRLLLLLLMMVLVDFDWLSNLRFMFSATHSALHSDEVARFEWRVAPQTWHQQRQQRQADPALSATDLIGCCTVTRAWMVNQVTL